MAKKTKDTTVSSTGTAAKSKAPANPEATRNLVRLLNILALLLAITAFLLQLFAVLSHHWKYQVTQLQPLFGSPEHGGQANVYDDSRIDQSYGLYSRYVKVYANNDEQLDVLASTRFPRVDNGEEDLHTCLSRTSTLRGALLTCSPRLDSPGQCHCRRYPHWNAIIFFEITALVLLGLVVVVASLLTTQYHHLLKLVGVALSFLAFLFLLFGLIVLLGYLKRETHSIADTYPHIHDRLSRQVGRRYSNEHHTAVRRQAHEKYRAYPLTPDQHAYNETHFQQFSQSENKWIYVPYSSITAGYAPRQQPSGTRRTPTRAPVLQSYGPVIGNDQVFEHTRARIGWSTVLSILALILSLLLPLLLAFSWLTAKKIVPRDVTTTTTTTTILKSEYPVGHDTAHETVPLTSRTGAEIVRQGPTYDSRTGPDVARQGPGYDGRAGVDVARQGQTHDIHAGRHEQHT